MDKLKGMLKISERDKKLLVVVLAVLIMGTCLFLWISESFRPGRYFIY